jgi:hypothetical protein
MVLAVLPPDRLGVALAGVGSHLPPARRAPRRQWFKSAIDQETMSDNTTGVYMISGCAVPAQNLGDHGYFGLSIDIGRRFDDHERALKKGSHANKYLQNCFTLYGGSNYFIWAVVEECPAEVLSEREIHHITEGNTYQNPKGFNLTPGGEAGVSQAACKPFVFKDIKSDILLSVPNGTRLSGNPVALAVGDFMELAAR